MILICIIIGMQTDSEDNACLDGVLLSGERGFPDGMSLTGRAMRFPNR